MGRDRPAGQGRGSRRCHDHQLRHRLARGARADHRHLGAARGLRGRDRQAQAARAGAAGGDQPDQHAGGGRGHPGRRQGGHGLAGASAAGRPAVGGQGARRHAPGHQHLHRLQPGLPGPRVREQAGQLPGQSARLPRDGPHLQENVRAEDRRRGRGGPGGTGLRDGRRRARPPRDPVRCGRRDRRAVQLRQADSGQGGIPRDAALLPPPAGGNPGGREAVDPSDCGRPDRLRRGRAGHRHHPAQGRLPRRRPRQGRQLRGRAVGPGKGGRPRRTDRGRRHRLRRGRISDP